MTKKEVNVKMDCQKQVSKASVKSPGDSHYTTPLIL